MDAREKLVQWLTLGEITQNINPTFELARHLTLATLREE